MDGWVNPWQFLHRLYCNISNTMKPQPVTFNNLNQKRVSSIIYWALSLLAAAFHVSRGEGWMSSSKFKRKEGAKSK